MKFSQTKRDTDEPRNYHPGPGQYELVDYRDILDHKKASTAKNQHSSWGYGERFNDTNFKNGTKPLGPGEYIGPQEWAKPRKTKRIHPTFESDSRKILTIPSIPSQHQNLGYQETSDGLLVMVQNPKTTVQGDVGPGSYDINISPAKPKTKVFSFSKLPQASKKQDGEKNSSEVGSDFYNVSKINGPFPDSPKRVEQAEKSPSTKRKPYSLAASKKDFTITTEKFEYPGPGHYYNEQVFSCFKAKSNSTSSLPGFNSKLQRVSVLVKDTELPGPGKYNTEKAQDFVTSKAPAHGFVGSGRFEMSEKEKALPGPGSYELKSIFTDNSAKDLIKQMIIDKPPAFGTSTKRFVRSSQTILETPGPGSYELPGKTKKKSKKTIRIINPSALPLEEPAEQQGALISFRGKPEGDVGLNKLFYDLPKGHKPYPDGETSKLKGNSGGAGSSFKSQSKRFLSSAGVSSLGPGSYSVPSENFKIGSFNQQKDLLSKSNRDINLEGSARDSLGPGYYDPKVDLVHPHKFSLKLRPDPKYEPKFSLLSC